MVNEAGQNDYVVELKKFLKQEVVVRTIDNEEIKGNCRAINFQHLNVVLMTDKEKILVKNIKSITRQRSFSNGTK
jgi:small nuclear ribonucleoprotein (snRNP)-like protein